MVHVTSRRHCVDRPLRMSENISEKPSENKSENMTVLVTGASGTLGTVLVPRLAKDGHDVRPMSRSARPGWVAADLRTGRGLAEAVRDADAIVHLASAPRKPRDTDVAGTRRLVTAAGAAGVRHLVYLSINGVDRVPYGYYRAKLAAEEIIRTSGVPFTIVRAAQFHEFTEMLLATFSRLGPVIIDPRFKAQPVALADVADRVAELLADPPEGRTIEYAGPRVIMLDEAARTWLAARGVRRPILRVPIPGRLGRAFRAGGLTTTATPMGTRTWEDYLAEKY